jgi:hypothetical protein
MDEAKRRDEFLEPEHRDADGREFADQLAAWLEQTRRQAGTTRLQRSARTDQILAQLRADRASRRSAGRTVARGWNRIREWLTGRVVDQESTRRPDKA